MPPIVKKFLAQRLRSCVRTEDTVARLGGDEFVILLDGIADLSEVLQVVERIRTALAAPVDLAGQPVPTTASIGITLSTTGYTRPEEVLRDADTAMYRAKQGGPGHYAVFDPAMHAQVLTQRQLEAALQQALARHELVLHYQPVVALASGQIVGVEALVRWQHPQRGLLAPDQFLAVAETTGLIVPLGAWVLRTACAQLQAWQQAGVPQLWMAVNLSARQVTQAGLDMLIPTVLEATQLDPAALYLELTESSVLEDAAATLPLLEQLTARGVHLALDDFGTGYSSLAYLTRLPLRSVKMAAPFVRNIATDATAAAIASAIIALAHHVGLRVIAEGVETEAQRAILAQQQCDLIQGYLVSRPLPAEALLPLLREGHAPPQDPAPG